MKITMYVLLSLYAVVSFPLFGYSDSDHLEKKAEEGCASAQYTLALRYFEGIGANRNLEQAFYWLYKAAVRGHDRAAYELGVLYSKGDGTTEDLHKAFYLIRISAEKGNLKAGQLLGMMYRFGIGTVPNEKMALRWLDDNAGFPLRD